MPGVLIVEAMAQTGAIAVLVEEENRGKIAFFAGIDDCRFKRIVEPGDVLTLDLRDRHGSRADRAREGDRARRRRARRARDAHLRGGALARVLGATTGVRIGITGLGTHVPDRVMTNDELARIVETSDEWIRERTGIRERRIASDDEALTDIAMPAARRGSRRCGGRRRRHRPPDLRDGDART